MTSPYGDRELCIVNDEGVIEDGFYDVAAVQRRIAEPRYGGGKV